LSAATALPLAKRANILLASLYPDDPSRTLS